MWTSGNNGPFIKYENINPTHRQYWLSTPSPFGNGAFAMITYGSPNYTNHLFNPSNTNPNTGGAGNAHGVAPAFCVGAP
jgi:hypothetical protein